MGRISLSYQNMAITLQEIQEALTGMPESKPLIYRLYHDSQGKLLFYSMEDLPGLYIDIDQETFARNASNVRVRDGKLQTITWQTTAKLLPGSTGTQCHVKDVAVVVTQNGQHWNKKTYEQN